MISVLHPVLRSACYLAREDERYSHRVLSYTPYVLYSLELRRDNSQMIW